jgi:hypothetical protein
MTDRFEDIDLAIERVVFLWNAKEGNPGLYDLTWELSYYNLTVEDKYKIAHLLVREIIVLGLATLNKYSDITLNEKIESVSIENLEAILNSPNSWNPCDEIFSISLTDIGEEYLSQQTSISKERLVNRLTKKKK